MPLIKMPRMGKKSREQEAASNSSFNPLRDKTMRRGNLQSEDEQHSRESGAPAQAQLLEDHTGPPPQTPGPSTDFLEDASDGTPEDLFNLREPIPEPQNQQQKSMVKRKQISGDVLHRQSPTDQTPAQSQTAGKRKATADSSINSQSPTARTPIQSQSVPRGVAPSNEQRGLETSTSENQDEEPAPESGDQYSLDERTLQSSPVSSRPLNEMESISPISAGDSDPAAKPNEGPETDERRIRHLTEQVKHGKRIIATIVGQQNADQKRIKELQTQVTQRDKNIQQMGSDMTDIEHENSLLRNQSKAHEKTLKEQEEANISLRNQQVLDKQRILTLEGQCTAHEQKIADLERQMETAQRTILTLETLDSTAKATIKDLENQVRTQRTAHEQRLIKLDERHKAAQQTILTLESQLSTARITIQDLESEIHENDEEIEDLRKQCTEHEKRHATLNLQHMDAQKKVRDLESQDRSARAKITDLENRVDAGEKAIQELRSQHSTELGKLKTQHELDIQKLVQQHARVISENEAKQVAELTRLKAQHAEKAERLEKECQAAVERMAKQHEQQRAALTDEHRRAIEQLKKSHQDLEAKMQQLQVEMQSRLKQAEGEREELLKKHQMALHDQAEEFDAQKEDLVSQHDRATHDLRRQVQELNTALIARDEDLYSASVFNVQGLPQDTDAKLKAHFVEIEQLVDSLGRLPWLDGSELGSDRDLQPLVGKHGLRIVKKAIVQDLVWCVLFQSVFASPFRIFGAEGTTMESQWVSHCGQGTSDNPATYMWPKPSVRAERWRYMTLTRCKEILKESLSQWDARASIKKGFGDSSNALRSELRETLAAVVTVTAETSAKIDRLAKLATLKWLDFQLHRCRIMITLTGSGTVSLPQRISEIRNGGLTLTVLPKVGRYGNNKGTDLELYTSISGSGGESLELARR